jgi:ABC-type phosphate transport system substrate-binding protein
MITYKKLINTLLLSTLVASTYSLAEVAVVVHPDNPNTMSNNDVKRIFLGKTKFFPDGSQAMPIIQSAGNTSNDFNANVLKKSGSQLKAYWSKLIFTGKGTKPDSALDDAAVIELVSKNPNIIGYIDSASAGAGVKVVAKF